MTETMQDSGVEWIGAIPNGWRLDRLKDIVSLRDEKSTEKTEDEDYLELEDLEQGTGRLLSIRNTLEVGSAVMKFYKNDVLFGKLRPYLQKYHLAKFDGKCTGEILAFKPERITPEFLLYFIASDGFIKICTAMSYGAKMPRVNYPKQLASLPVCLPKVQEQQAIAQYLDERCGKLDSIIAIKKQQIQTLDALRQSIIYQAVTKGLDDSVKLVDSGVEWLGEIPKGWKVDKLKRISDIRYGLGQPPASKDDGLPMIRATDVYRGTIVGDKLLTIDPDTLPLGRNPYLKKDEIIVVRSGAYTGDSAIIPAQYAGAIAGYDMVVTVNRANPKFIAYCLLCDYVLERQLRLLMLRAAQPHLNSQELGGILLVLPKSNEDQQKIVDYLDDETQRLAQLKANLTQQIGVLLDYKKSLIYECVTGKKRVFKLVKNTKKGYSTL
jgi:type I restriction enzyme S subunit